MANFQGTGHTGTYPVDILNLIRQGAAATMRLIASITVAASCRSERKGNFCRPTGWVKK